MTAALVASLQGLSVLLCEKSDQVGGTGSTSAGTLWIPGNHQSRDAGFDDSAAKAEEYLDALVGSASGRELRTAFLKTGPAAIDYLERNTDVKFVPCGRHPDYRSNMKGAAVSGRAIIPQPFDGRLLGADFARLRPPIAEYMLFGGMMIGKADIPPLLGRFKSLANFSYAARLLARYVVDRLRYPRGTRLMMGNALTARLFYSLRKRGVEILFNAQIAAIDERDGRVAGATIKSRGRQDLRQSRERASCSPPAAMDITNSIAKPSWRIPVPAHSMAANSIGATGSPSANGSARASRRKSTAAAGCGRRHPSPRARTAARAFIRTCCSTAPSRA